ncbi:MAG: hypothetical protein QM820_44125 [Minicystis sp.]
MSGRLRFHVTPQTIRVEIDGAGIVFEDEAALALVYDARAEDIAVVDWGRRALTVPERLLEIELRDVRKRAACIVPEEEARWYDGDRRLGAPPAAKFDDPWEHHGEIIVVRPWAPGAGSLRTWAWSLLSAHRAFFAGDASARLGVVKRWWLQHMAPVDVVLPELPADAKDHDRLVHALWTIFGRRVWLNGTLAKLRQSPRLQWRDFRVAGWFAGATLLLAVMRVMQGRPVFDGAFVVAGAVSILAALVSWDVAMRRGPSVSEADNGTTTPRSSMRHETAGPDVNPADYAGGGDFRLGIVEGSQWAMFPLLVLGALLAGALKFLGPGVWPFNLVLGIISLAGVFFCIWLGLRLAATRLSLGERGLTLRLNGWYSRPRLIPYASIRHVAFQVTMTGQRALRLVLHDGQQVSFGFPLDTSRAANEAAEKLLLGIEAEVTSRLGSPGSYRMAGGTMRGEGQSS